MRDWENYFDDKNEQPLDNLVDSYSNTSVFRTMAFVGDSLSSGEFVSYNKNGDRLYHDMYEYSWGQHIARKNGLMGYSFSRGGMTAEEYLTSFAEAKGFWDKDKACQAYVLALGVNDILGEGIPVGSMDDVNLDDYRQNKPTFLGNYAAIVSRYKEISPDAKFFFVTFPNVPEKNQKATQEMVAALYALAEKCNNAYVIDLYHYGPLYDEEFERRFYLDNHMNPSGYLFTAKLIDSYIDYIIRHNPDEFRAAGFIGTGITYRKPEGVTVKKH